MRCWLRWFLLYVLFCDILIVFMDYLFISGFCDFIRLLCFLLVCLYMILNGNHSIDTAKNMVCAKNKSFINECVTFFFAMYLKSIRTKKNNLEIEFGTHHEIMRIYIMCTPKKSYKNQLGPILILIDIMLQYFINYVSDHVIDARVNEPIN